MSTFILKKWNFAFNFIRLHNFFQDFTGPYREQEAKYMERTDEAIFNRASEEHIRQPIPYDDNDSVKVKLLIHTM